MLRLKASDWQCGMCGYFNEDGDDLCDMCDAPIELDEQRLTQRAVAIAPDAASLHAGAGLAPAALADVAPCAQYDEIEEVALAREDALRYSRDDSFAWTAAVHVLNASAFGNMSFRGAQLPAIHAALDGRDCVLLLPTGAGKSLAYQLPALARPGMTLVIGPLVALACDQVAGLRARGIEARLLSSHQPAEEKAYTLALLDADPPPRLLYVTPERVSQSPAFLRTLARLAARGLLQRIAVDEAHCIAAYGHDFRPDYLRIGQLRERFADVPITALTATATHAVLGELMQRLRLRRPVVFRAPLDRPNIRFQVRPKTAGTLDEIAQLAQELCPLDSQRCMRAGARARHGAPDADADDPPRHDDQALCARIGGGCCCATARRARHAGTDADDDSDAKDARVGSDVEAEDDTSALRARCDDGLRARSVGVVYCLSCKEVETVADALVRRGVRASFYHGQLELDERQAAHEALRVGRVQLLVATCAFGMGVDLPTVSLVAHFTMPGAPDALYQEAGRAGRNGQPAQHVLFFAYADKNRIEAMLRRGALARADSDAAGAECASALRRRLADLLTVTGYALDAAECRRVRLLRAFSQTPLARAPAARADCCDVCARDGDGPHPPRDARALAAHVLALLRALRGGRGAEAAGGLSVRYLAKLAAGSRGRDVLDAEHQKLPGYAAVAELGQAGAVRLVQAMVVARFLNERATPTAHGGVSTDVSAGPRASELLDGAQSRDHEPFLVCLPPLSAPARDGRAAGRPLPVVRRGASAHARGRASPRADEPQHERTPLAAKGSGWHVHASSVLLETWLQPAGAPGACARGVGAGARARAARSADAGGADARTGGADGRHDGGGGGSAADDDDDEAEAEALLCTLDCEGDRRLDPVRVRCGWDADDLGAFEFRHARCANVDGMAAVEQLPDGSSGRKRPCRRELSAARTRTRGDDAMRSTCARAREGATPPARRARARARGGGAEEEEEATMAVGEQQVVDAAEHVGATEGARPRGLFAHFAHRPNRAPLARLDEPNGARRAAARGKAGGAARCADGAQHTGEGGDGGGDRTGVARVGEEGEPNDGRGSSHDGGDASPGLPCGEQSASPQLLREKAASRTAAGRAPEQRRPMRLFLTSGGGEKPPCRESSAAVRGHVPHGAGVHPLRRRGAEQGVHARNAPPVPHAASADRAARAHGAVGVGVAADDDAAQPLRACKQDPRLVRRVCQLGREGLPPAAIDRRLSADGFKNSSGRPWAAKNDGRVVVRILLNHGLAVSGSDPKIREYARSYAAVLEGRV